MLLEHPDFFNPSKRILEMTDGYTKPFYHLDFDYDKPDLSSFTDTAKSMISSGNIFKYEDYSYLHNGNVVNNLEQCKSLYKKIDDKWTYNRIERLVSGHNINFTLYTKHFGWFPEVREAHPDLVEMCEKFIDVYKIDTWKILIGRMETDLLWHMDIDGYYGFRFPLGIHPWELKFRKIHEEHAKKFLTMSWSGKFIEVNELVNTETYSEEIVIDQDEGKSFIFNSIDYVHMLKNNHPQYFLFIKGII